MRLRLVSYLAFSRLDRLVRLPSLAKPLKDVEIWRLARGNMIMRTMIAILALLAAGTVARAGAASPVSYDYPWCLYGGELGYSGDCS